MDAPKPQNREPDPSPKDELSTYRFAIYLLIGLTIFTVSVALLSRCRYKKYTPAEFAADDAAIEDARRAELAERNGQEAGREGGSRLQLPDIGRITPDFQEAGGVGEKVHYDEDGRAILPGRPNEGQEKMQNWQSKFKILIGRVFHVQTTPTKAADWLNKAALQYLKHLVEADRLMRRSGPQVFVRYKMRLDQNLVEAQSNYLKQLQIFRDLSSDGMPGMPECASSMPRIDEMTRLPALPTFDAKLRGGEDEAMVEYIVGRQVADPIRTIEVLRDQINGALDCARQATDVANVPTGVREVISKERSDAESGVMRALRPGDIPENEMSMSPVDTAEGRTILPPIVKPGPNAAQSAQPAQPPSPGATPSPLQWPYQKPAPTPEPAPADNLIGPTYVTTPLDQKKDGIYGPLAPGETPENEKTPTPAPKSGPKFLPPKPAPTPTPTPAP